MSSLRRKCRSSNGFKQKSKCDTGFDSQTSENTKPISGFPQNIGKRLEQKICSDSITTLKRLTGSKYEQAKKRKIKISRTCRSPEQIMEAGEGTERRKEQDRERERERERERVK